MSQGIVNRKSSFADKSKLKRKSTTFLVPPNFDFMNDDSNTSRLMTPCYSQEIKLDNNVKHISTSSKSNLNNSNNKMIPTNEMSNTVNNEREAAKFRPATPKLHFNYFSSKSNNQPPQIMSARSINSPINSTSLTSSQDAKHLLKSRLPRISKVIQENLLKNYQENNNSSKGTRKPNQNQSFYFPLLTVRNNSIESGNRKLISFDTEASTKNIKAVNKSASATLSANHTKKLDYFGEPIGIFFVQNISNLGQSI